jgi:hypothetical protein
VDVATCGRLQAAVPKWLGPVQPPALCARLWKVPIACYWHEQRIEPSVVARYVTLASEKPESPAVSRLEAELGLTPAAMLRLRLIVEKPEPVVEASQDKRTESPTREMRRVRATSSRLRKVGRDEDGRGRYSLEKAGPGRLIDAAVATVLAVEAASFIPSAFGGLVY